MAITRQGPVHNMDTNEPLQILPPNKRFTRGQAHRLLKANNVPHDPGAPMDHLLYLMQMHNLNPAFVPPGKEETKSNVVKVEFNDLPNNVPKLRKLCKERGIRFKITDKKSDLIKRLT